MWPSASRSAEREGASGFDGAPRRHAGWRLTGGVALAVTLAVPALPSAAPHPSPFCSAVSTFNTARPSSKAESLRDLQQLADVAPARVKKALGTIIKAAKNGDVAAVLGQASGTQPGLLTTAGTTVTAAATGSCRASVNFLAAIPTGISARKVPARAWVRTVCSSLAAWGQSVDAAGAALVTPASGVTTTVPEERATFARFVGAAIDKTGQLVSQLNNAGTPNTKHGAAFAALVHDGVTQAQQGFVQAQPAVQALPDDPQAFQVQTKTLVQNLDDAGMHVVVGLHNAEAEIKDAVLSQAFFDESTCKGVA